MTQKIVSVENPSLVEDHSNDEVAIKAAGAWKSILDAMPQALVETTPTGGRRVSLDAVFALAEKKLI